MKTKALLTTIFVDSVQAGIFGVSMWVVTRDCHQINALNLAHP